MANHADAGVGRPSCFHLEVSFCRSAVPSIRYSLDRADGTPTTELNRDFILSWESNPIRSDNYWFTSYFTDELLVYLSLLAERLERPRTKFRGLGVLDSP